MDSGETREGIVVLGCPRSGTTMLRRLLDSHPHISGPGESYILTAASRFIEGEEMVDGLEVGVLNGLGFLGFAETEIIERLREFVFEFRRAHAAREGKRRWLEKTAIDAFHVDAIRRICGAKVHYVCVVRHGLDVVVSMQDWMSKTKRYPAEIHRYIQSDPRPHFAFAKAWAETTAKIVELAQTSPEDAILVRYEDLVDRTDAELARVLAFIGESVPAGEDGLSLRGQQSKGFSDWKSFARTTVDKASAGRWRTELTREDAAKLGPLVNPMLMGLGYDEIQDSPTLSGEQRRRRYEIGLSLQKLQSD